MAVEAKTKKTLLAAVSGAAKTRERSERMFDNLICRAVEQGITQTEVAAAAGVSQAHVSRTLAANRKQNEARNAARRERRRNEGGKV
jgi:CRP-like cAMP-binding protein